MFVSGYYSEFKRDGNNVVFGAFRNATECREKMARLFPDDKNFSVFLYTPSHKSYYAVAVRSDLPKQEVKQPE